MSMELDLSVLIIPTEADEISHLDTFTEMVTRDIEKLREIRRKVWTIRNKKQPIYRLPPEILLKIFVNLRSITHESTINYDYYSYNFPRPQWDWIDVTKVCRCWRDLALSHAPLWNTILFTDTIDKARVFLGRSKDLDIELYRRSHCDDSEILVRARNSHLPSDFAELILGHMGRLRMLHCTLDAYFEDNDSLVIDIKTWLSKPMPKLKEMHLSVVCAQVTPAVLEGWVPDSQLDVVELNGFGYAWDHPIFNDIQELILSHIRNGPSITETLTILENCSTRLRRLVIKSVRFQDNPLTGAHDVVHLPNLRAFDLQSGSEDSREVYFELLEKLNFVVNAYTDFSFDFRTNSSIQGNTPFTAIPDTLGRHIIHPQRRLNIIFSSQGQVRLALYQDDQDLFANGDVRTGRVGEAPLLKLDVGYVKNDHNYNAEDTITALVRQKWIRNAPYITLQFAMGYYTYNGTIALKKPLWIEVLEAMPSLTRIEIVYGDGFDSNDLESFDGFVSALMDLGSSNNGLQTYLVTNLKEIVLANFDLSGAEVLGVLWKLKDYLKFRVEDGKKLRSFRLTLREVNEEMRETVLKFSDIVDDFSFEASQSDMGDFKRRWYYLNSRKNCCEMHSRQNKPDYFSR